MPLATIILIGIGLSLDAVAVALACGMAMKRLRWRQIVRTAFFFGFFQMIMPLLGWLAGLSLRSLIGGIDHWIAFGLLVFIGAKMIREAFSREQDASAMDTASLRVLFTLALATSIDALAVGLSFSLLKVSVVTPVLVIGAITFALSFAAGIAGCRFGMLFGKKIEIIGGLILIAIGLKILIEHLQIIS